MSTLDEIRTAIKAKMDAVSGVGQVHGYERYAKEASKFSVFYKDETTERILGWHVRRISTRELFVDTGRWTIFHGWRIRGYMSLDDADATEQLFDMKIEELRDAFRDDDDLGGLAYSCIDPQSSQAGLQLLDHSPVLLAGVLCHKAELALTTQHLHP